MREYREDAMGSAFFVDLFVVVMDWRSDPRGFWVPSVKAAKEIGDLFREQHYGADIPPFRIYDTDLEGNLHECEIEWQTTTYTQDDEDGFNDYAHSQGRIVRKDTREHLANVGFTVDLRA